MNKFGFSFLILISIFSSNIVSNFSLFGAENTLENNNQKIILKESFEQQKDEVKNLLVDMKKAIPEVKAKFGNNCEIAFKSIIRFLEFVYQNVFIKGGKLTLKVLSMAGSGIKKGFIEFVDLSKVGLGFAGTGLDIAKKMAEFMKIVCEIIWVNLKGAEEAGLKVIKVGGSLTVATFVCFGYMAWWFGFKDVLVNIKEVLKLVGHPLIKRFIIAFGRFMTFTNNGLENVCDISFDNNSLKYKLLKWTIGWWYKPLFCEEVLDKANIIENNFLTNLFFKTPINA